MDMTNITADYRDELVSQLELVITALDSRCLMMPDKLMLAVTEILMKAQGVIENYPLEKNLSVPQPKPISTVSHIRGSNQ